MREAVICSPLRTPIGRFGGSLKSLTATELAATVIAELVRRTGVDPERIDEVILGQCNPSGESPAIGRVAALDAGLPESVAGSQVDRRCGSGLQAVLNAAMAVQTGAAEIVVAGGAESMSQVEHYATGMRFGAPAHIDLADRLDRARVTAGGRFHPIPGGMIETAENLRREYRISRVAQDELAVASHHRAVAAQDAGVFAAEIVPVEVSTRKGTETIAIDEHPRRDTSLEALGALRPIMANQDDAATVTAGNSSGQNDAAAVCLVTTRETADDLGLAPLLRVAGWALAGVAPERMGIGPVPATQQVLARLGLRMADLDLIELNEAFAAQVLAVTQEWGFGTQDFERLNVHGSGIALGHPVGATGARILCTLAYELQRRGGRYALETMCIGGGQGLAAVFERVT